jgi:hypothetical protein
MDAVDKKVLKSHIDGDVVIKCKDGERMLVRLISVDEDDGEIVYDLLRTNRTPAIETVGARAEQQPAFLIRFTQIESVSPAGGADQFSAGK